MTVQPHCVLNNVQQPHCMRMLCVCAGAEGAVYAAWFLESPVAVKKFERVESSLHEVEMYLRLGSHDNIVALW